MCQPYLSAKSKRYEIITADDILRHPLYVERAHEALSMLIDRIVLNPDPGAPDGMSIMVHGDLATILSTCAAAGSGRLPADFFDGVSQVSVVAGACNHLNLLVDAAA